MVFKISAPTLMFIAWLGINFTCPNDVFGQCPAPAGWFPHSVTPEPDFHKPTSNCEFHQWAWQEFLWLTQTESNGRIRLLNLPTAEMLFAPGRAPAALDLASVQRRLNTQILHLAPRAQQATDSTPLSAIHQAGSKGVVVDKNGNPLYYTSFVTHDYYNFVRTNKLYLKANYIAAGDKMTFPKKAVELKSSWRVVESGEPTDGFITTTAVIPKLKCKDGSGSCSGGGVGFDTTNQQEVTVALVGLHVVGVLEGHPEFVWSTFEHVNNAPDLPVGVPVNSAMPVSAKDFNFYSANTPAKDCAGDSSVGATLDVATQKLSPVTNVLRQFAFGGGDAEDTGNVKTLNKSVHDQLDAGSVLKNYMLVGGTWFLKGTDLVPGLTGAQMQKFAVGSIQISNSTMESFTQNPAPTPGARSNCFSCHSTKPDNIARVPAMNLNVSHILKQSLIDREVFTQLAAMNLSIKDVGAMRRAGFLQRISAERGFTAELRELRDSPLWSVPKTANKIETFEDVKSTLDKFVADNGVPISFAPHRAFWRTMTYQQFVSGDIPNVADPETGKPFKVLVVGKADESNIILSLRGTKGTVFDPETGSVGRMPSSGPFMADDDIQRLADWINAGAPE